MPNVGIVCGIAIFILKEKGEKHHLPHVRASYGGQNANYDIESANRIAGKMPLKQDRMIRDLLRRYKQNFLDEWNNLQQDNPQPAKKIF